MSLASLGFAVGVLLAVPTATSATSPVQGISFELASGEGAEPCPDRESLAAQVAKRLAETHGVRRVPVAEPVEITIARTDEGYVGTVTVLGAHGGTRRLVDAGEDCSGLGEALALTLSMIADGQMMADMKRPAALAGTGSPRPWEIGAGAVASANLLGAPSLGVGLDAVYYPWPRLATGIEVLWMPRRSIEAGGSISGVQAAAALAKSCWGALPFGGPVFPALCGTLGGGVLRGQGDGTVYVDARSVWRPWFVAGATLRVGMRLHRRLTFAAHAGYLFSLLRERFTVGGSGQDHQVYESDHPGWTGGAGLLVRIP